MEKINKLLLTFAAGIFISHSAFADIIELQSFSGAAANVNIKMTNGVNYHTGAMGVSFSEYGGAGSFKTYDKTTGTTFQSWCVDIFHDFSFGNPGSTTDTLSSASKVFGQNKADELGRLYTVYAQNLSANNNSNMNPAFQLAVWAIVNTPLGTDPSITGSVFSASSGAEVNSDATYLLTQMGKTQSLYSASIWSVQGNTLPTGGASTSWGAQDVVMFSAVPEPETYAMLLAGLGLIGATVKRRKAKQA